MTSGMTAAAILSPRPASRGRRLWLWPEPSVLPGYPLSLAVTLGWLGAIVCLPLAALALRPWELGVSGVWAALAAPRTLAALRLSFGLSALAALIDAPLGLLIAWTLVRYEFPGRRLLDAIVDLPFALPTAVAGIALTALYAPTGVLGALAARVGLKTAYNPFGIFIALIFIGLPFVVRQIQPVLLDFDQEVEEAARTLGAGPLQTFAQVIHPAIAPAIVAGVALAFARAVGEYGSVIFIAGNMPGVSEIAPLLIVIKLEEFDYAGAAAIGLCMVLVSLAVLLALNSVQATLAARGRT
jgi:sulfate transport system permease protein